ncbi:hypothetical protein ACFO4E_05550 [Nocardiopsis mangrovi]|uniref:DUF4429 domain-containing protein n=1 Tax=Nocardiopsis mangrovi TaxID=1179818 RepID=A0ABV9DTL2_9ACTN
MEPFVSGVASSLAASALAFIVARLVSGRARGWLTVLVSRWTGLGVRRVYLRQQDAESDLARDLRRARWLRVLAGRGNALTREAFAPLRSVAGEGLESARILLPTADPSPDSWLGRREKELQDGDLGMDTGLLAEQVRTNAAYVDAIARERSSVELRRYELPHLFRVVATDEGAYLTFYGRGRHGRVSPCIYAARPGMLYDAALALFSAVWQGSTPTAESTR